MAVTKIETKDRDEKIVKLARDNFAKGWNGSDLPSMARGIFSLLSPDERKAIESHGPGALTRTIRSGLNAGSDSARVAPAGYPKDAGSYAASVLASVNAACSGTVAEKTPAKARQAQV